MLIAQPDIISLVIVVRNVPLETTKIIKIKHLASNALQHTISQIMVKQDVLNALLVTIKQIMGNQVVAFVLQVHSVGQEVLHVHYVKLVITAELEQAHVLFAEQEATQVRLVRVCVLVVTLDQLNHYKDNHYAPYARKDIMQQILLQLHAPNVKLVITRLLWDSQAVLSA